MTVHVRIAGGTDLEVLSRKLLALAADKEGKVYQDNVAKLGIPDEYVKEVFSEEALLKELKDGNITFYIAAEDEKIMGFAQIIQQEDGTAELDRIIVFPEQTRKGVGTSLLHEALSDQKQKGVRIVVVNAGKEETHARRFYEKNGFTQIGETTIDTPWGRKLSLTRYRLHL